MGNETEDQYRTLKSHTQRARSITAERRCSAITERFPNDHGTVAKAKIVNYFFTVGFFFTSSSYNGTVAESQT
jgi:hypothetical protein